MRLRSERSGTKTAERPRHSTRASGGGVSDSQTLTQSPALPRSEPAGGLLALQRLIIQRDAAPALRDPEALSPGQVHEAAQRGTSGTSGPLPYLDIIQKSFGKHDVSQIKSHTDAAATEGARAMGADAFATGSRVAFARQPTLHTAAHEAAHVIQQRAGVSLPGGVGSSGDSYERNADAVADTVVQGRSAESLLDRQVGDPFLASVQRETGLDEEEELGVQAKAAVQRETGLLEEEELGVQAKAAVQRETGLLEEDEVGV